MHHTKRLLAICSIMLVYACSDSNNGSVSTTELDAQAEVDSRTSSAATIIMVDASAHTEIFVE